MVLVYYEGGGGERKDVLSGRCDHCLCFCMSDYFRTLLHVTFSDQPERTEMEQQWYIYFIDFIEECEGMWYVGCANILPNWSLDLLDWYYNMVNIVHDWYCNMMVRMNMFEGVTQYHMVYIPV